MTTEEIEMLTGRELDAAVDRVACAGKYFVTVSGNVATRFVSESESQSHNPFNWRKTVPHYSTDDGEAVKLLLGTGDEFYVNPMPSGGFYVSIIGGPEAEGPTFPSAACLAFLKITNTDRPDVAAMKQIGRAHV